MTRIEWPVTTASSLIGQVDDAVGVAHQRRAVAGDEVLAVADADHQRAAQPGRDDHIRPIAKHHRQAVRAAQLRERRLHRLDQRRISDRPAKPLQRRGRAHRARSATSWAMTSVSVAVLQ